MQHGDLQNAATHVYGVQYVEKNKFVAFRYGDPATHGTQPLVIHT